MRFTMRLLSSSSSVSASVSVIQKSWREASTLLIASEVEVGQINNAGSSTTSLEYLMMERSRKSSFMPGGLCFPGGTISLADSSRRWDEFYRSAGLNLSVMKFIDDEAKKPDAYADNYKEPGEFLSREVSFRITAIRETFEECGVLLCKPFHAAGGSPDTKPLEDFQSNQTEVSNWQKKVSLQPEEFICLCHTLRCVPDLQALVEWSNWLTPVSYKPMKHRFDTLFYMTLLPMDTPKPKVYPDGQEMASFRWLSATDLLKGHGDGTHTLLPPQAYEMCRLQNITSGDQMGQLLKSRNTHGVERWCPFLFETKDHCTVSTFPGDDLYPKNPDIHTYKKFGELDMTAEELENSSVKKHRTIIPREGTPSIRVSPYVDQYGQFYTPPNKNAIHTMNLFKLKF